MTTRGIQVAMCVDSGYVLPLAVALASLDRVSAADAVTVHVLHPGLPGRVRERLAVGLRHLEVVWRTVDEQEVDGAHYSTFLSSGSLYRLLLGSLLPPEVDRVVYLDADTVVLDSLHGIHSADLSNHVLGAVRDASVPWAASLMGAPWRQLGLDPSTPYFNSGVLLIDLDRWRTQAVGERCLALLRAARLRWGDQDALNGVLAGGWLELPRRWNLQTPELTGESAGWALWRTEVEEAIAAPAVLHYTGLDKPWQHATQHPRADDWLACLDRTAWSGWRPSPPHESRAEMLARSVVRRARKWRARRTGRRALPRDLARGTS